MIITGGVRLPRSEVGRSTVQESSNTMETEVLKGNKTKRW